MERTKHGENKTWREQNMERTKTWREQERQKQGSWKAVSSGGRKRESEGCSATICDGCAGPVAWIHTSIASCGTAPFPLPLFPYSCIPPVPLFHCHIILIYDYSRNTLVKTHMAGDGCLRPITHIIIQYRRASFKSCFELNN